MTIGVVQHVFRDCRDDDARFARARRLGIDTIEPDLTAADLAEGASARLAALRAAREAHGVGIPSLCMGFHNNEGLVGAMWRGETPVREIRAALGWCRALDAGALLVPFFFANDPRSRAQREYAADQLAPLAREAEQLGVELCFEGTLTATQYWRMAERIGSAAFGVYFDPGNAVWLEQDPGAELRALGRLVRRCHLKDTRLAPGDARLGTGLLDLPRFAAALRDVGYGGPLILEAFGRSDEDLLAELALARRHFAGDGGVK